MKYCPSCGTQYTDDTLRFCLQDGAQLSELRETETPTVTFDEAQTIARSRNLPGQSGFGSETLSDTGNTGGRRRSVLLPVIIAGTAAIILFIAGGVGTWIFLTGVKTGSGNNSSNSANVGPTATPGNVSGFFPTPSPRNSIPPPGDNGSPTPFPTQQPSTIDREQAKKEVSDRIYSWKSNAEALDLNSYMQSYAESIDYYKLRGASRAAVRNDKARAFGKYRSMRIELSNFKISIDESGFGATAEFDKEWDFRGTGSSSGKVRSQLRLRRESGRWLITGERDLRVFYVN